jgi:formylglycine-generating enzyme required for sulfatase activity
MYPQGSTATGTMDMAGNLFEWCQNDYEDFQIVDGYDNRRPKVLRGGSFDANKHRATCGSLRSPYKQQALQAWFADCGWIAIAPLISG